MTETQFEIFMTELNKQTDIIYSLYSLLGFVCIGGIVCLVGYMIYKPIYNMIMKGW